MTHKQETRIPLRGDLRIITRDASDFHILSVWEKKNVITFAGTEVLVKLMAPNVSLGANVQVESQIKAMRFGSSNTTPQRTDLALGNDADRVIGASGTVEFNATLASGDGNGNTYREAGLFTRGTDDDPGVTTGQEMFSRQILPDQIKTAAVELEFRWRITFTV